MKLVCTNVIIIEVELANSLYTLPFKQCNVTKNLNRKTNKKLYAYKKN